MGEDQSSGIPSNQQHSQDRFGPSMSSYRKQSGGRRPRIRLLLPPDLLSHVKTFGPLKAASGRVEHPSLDIDDSNGG